MKCFFWLCCLVIVLLWTSSAVSCNNITTIVIEPEKLYCGEKLHNGKSIHYHLKKLQSNTGYELRISYPAVIPTEFIIKDVSKQITTRRRLLNIEKLVFWTDSDEEEKYVQVTAFRVGIPVKPSLIELPVEYDIILERLYSGLPWNVWKVIALVLSIIFIVIKYCLQPVKNWINREVEKLE